ncbi:MAG: hypothetical protein II707_07985, partial [Spirochaetales bacterium]|nr:hypothetical protein [Spirochaetales bacterium]
PIILCSLVSLAHIIVAACTIGRYYYKKSELSMKHLLPDIALTHDDKKGFTEGYGVSVGMRVRI